MADRWVIAYDVDVPATRDADVTTATVYNRIKSCLSKAGFSSFMQRSVYAMPDDDGALVRVYRAIQALSELDERMYIKRLHVFKIDGALNDVLPIVDAGRESASADGELTEVEVQETLPA